MATKSLEVVPCFPKLPAEAVEQTNRTITPNDAVEYLLNISRLPSNMKLSG